MPNQEMRWVAEDCGLDVAIEMIRRLRGVKIYVPNRKPCADIEVPADMPNDDIRVVAEYCGMDVANKLLGNMGGCFISIPRQGPWCTRFILKHYNGKNVSRLALHLGVSANYVYKVIRASSRGKPNKKNGSLQAVSIG
jgi:hypothetical protein